MEPEHWWLEGSSAVMPGGRCFQVGRIWRIWAGTFMPQAQGDGPWLQGRSGPACLLLRPGLVCRCGKLWPRAHTLHTCQLANTHLSLRCLPLEPFIEQPTCALATRAHEILLSPSMLQAGPYHHQPDRAPLIPDTNKSTSKTTMNLGRCRPEAAVAGAQGKGDAAGLEAPAGGSL